MTTFSPNVEAAGAPPVFDAHVDLVYALQQADPIRTLAETRLGPFTPASLSAGQVRVVNSALFCRDDHNGPEAVLHLKQQWFLSETLTGELPVIRSRPDLDRAWNAADGTAKLLLLENADALVDLGTGPLEGWGIRTVGLTHVGGNRLADGNAVADPGGLKPAARELLPQLEQAGLAIDLAHLAEPGFRELLDLYHGPVCCSHTGLRRYCDLPRNLSDEQIKALRQRGGLIGLAFAPEMLTGDGQADAETVFRQLDDLVQRFGWEGFGLGSDLGGYTGSCRGLENHGGLPAWVARLARSGYPRQAIRGLCGENWRNFYRQILPEETA